MTDPAPNLPPRRRLPSHRGRWTIAAIFAAAGAVLAGLSLSPRGQSPPVPAGLAEGWPDRPLTFVVLDAGPLGPRPELVAEAALKAARQAGPPDAVLLIDIEASMVPPVAEALRMQGSFHPQLYQRARRGRPNVGPPPGVCLLSRHGLYAGRPVGDVKQTVGVTATAGVDGRRFGVTCLDVRENPNARPLVAAAPAGLVGGAADDGLFAQLAGTAGGGGITAATTAVAGPWLDVVARSADPPTLVVTVRPAAGPAPAAR